MRLLIFSLYLIKFIDGTTLCYDYPEILNQDYGKTFLVYHFDSDKIPLSAQNIVYIKNTESCGNFDIVKRKPYE